jgi:hypothetical protein
LIVTQGRYTLNPDGKPQLEPDLIKWASWMEGFDRVVCQEQIGASRVSTVFLGLNHRFAPGPPVLWETMVFGGPLDEEQDRCSGTREQAEAMHAAMVARVRSSE